MARVDLRLKLALYASQLRKGGALAGLVAQALIALGVAVWLAAGVGRRGRDRATLLSFLVGLVAWGAYAAAGDLQQAAIELRPSPVLDTLAALPPGALGHAVVLAGDGQLAQAALLVAYGALGLAVA